MEKYHTRATRCSYYLRFTRNYLGELQLHRYLEELWKVFSIGNKAIEEHSRWVKIKEGRNDEALATVALVANLLAKASVMLHSIMPSTTAKIAVRSDLNHHREL